MLSTLLNVSAAAVSPWKTWALPALTAFRFRQPGWAWNGTICELTAEAAAIQGQQVAWTIIANAKDELGTPPFPEIVVHDASGSRWEPIEPDESFLPPGEDY